MYACRKTASVSNKVPKPGQIKIKEALKDIWVAESRTGSITPMTLARLGSKPSTGRLCMLSKRAMTKFLPKLASTLAMLVTAGRSEEHTSELQSRGHIVC